MRFLLDLSILALLLVCPLVLADHHQKNRTDAQILANNKARFPNDYLDFPETYDVGDPAPTGTSSARVIWRSPAAVRRHVESETRVWYKPGMARPPGKFLLNMLTKNEEENLARTLPHWIPVIDYWIIGVDDKNTDNSVQVIKRLLSDVPGEIVEVHFDGIGPTWTQLVSIGIKDFPGATHGIIADADFKPMVSHLDRMELDIRCSKHMYTIWTEDHRNERKMDWVYRNVPGARVSRRTHQIIDVPKFPNQEVFQTLLPLPIEEKEGGYGDRSGTKNQRYIQWLELDLIDYPNDTRTLYYLGYAHFDIFNNNRENAELRAEAWEHLAKGVAYFKQRVAIEGGNKEERWFAMLKLGEIYERFYREWPEAEKWYVACTKLDDERADAFFYLGQHYRLHGQYDRAEPWLHTAARLPMPERSLFQWRYLYRCLARLEYARSVGAMAVKQTPLKVLKRSRTLLAKSDCTGGDPGNPAERAALLEKLEGMLKEKRKDKKKQKEKKLKKEQEAKKKKEAKKEEEEEEEQEETQASKKDSKSSSSSSSSSSASTPKRLSAAEYQSFIDNDEKVPTINKLLRFLLDHTDHLESQFVQNESDIENIKHNADDAVSVYSELMERVHDLDKYASGFSRLKSPPLKYQYINSCRNYRLATASYVKFVKEKEQSLEKLWDDEQLSNEFRKLSTDVKVICRS